MNSDEKIQNNEDLSVVRGIIRHVTFYNPENGWTVVDVKISENAFPLKMVGYNLPQSPGCEFLARGKFRTHEKFGKQFDALSAELVAPSTPENLENFLGSGMFPGIGEKTARILVKSLGLEALNTIHNQPDKLFSIKGIGRKKAIQIAQSVKDHHLDLELQRYLNDLEIGPKLRQKILLNYGSEIIEILKANPYRLAYEIEGVGFLTADKIAMRNGLSPESPLRQKAGIYFALADAADDGHCFLTSSQLSTKTAALLNLEHVAEFEELLQALTNEKKIVQEDDKIYSKKIYEAEKLCADFLKLRLEKQAPAFTEENINLAIKSSEDFLGGKLSEEQITAVKSSCLNYLLLITGGPGCGKTTIIKTIVDAYLKAGKKIILAAPTGKAAQRMTAVCDYPASTIHRLLKFDPFKGGFQHSPLFPIMDDPESGTPPDLIIIDESSMIDIELAKHLLSAICPETRLIMVGDKDQLPSVGPGRVFADLLSVESIPKVQLKMLFRRAEESAITIAAHEINQGQIKSLPVPDGKTRSDFYLVEKHSSEDTVKTLESLVRDQIPAKFGFTQDEITVLTPMNKGPLGTIELNRRLQQVINPESPSKAEIKFGDNIFRLNDSVCQRVNNYNIDSDGVFNGDLGKIKDINAKDKSLIVRLWDGREVKYTQTEINQLNLAYALTIHRSQGSEMPCVIMILHDSQFNMLERQLLYTGVTRAKKLLILLSNRRTLDIASRRVRSTRRQTSLVEKIIRPLA